MKVTDITKTGDWKVETSGDGFSTWVVAEGSDEHQDSKIARIQNGSKNPNEIKANADLIAEAGNVALLTGKSPMELWEENKILKERLLKELNGREVDA
jgi:hypothetical protein